MRYHRVKRPFRAERPLKGGEVVDTSAWRNVKALVGGRYLEPVDASTLTEDELASLAAKPTAIQGAAPGRQRRERGDDSARRS